MTTPTNPEPENKMPEVIFAQPQIYFSYGVWDVRHVGTSYTRTDIVQELREQLKHALNPIHTCGEQCQRPACVIRRECDQLQKKLETVETIIEYLEKTIIEQRDELLAKAQRLEKENTEMRMTIAQHKMREEQA